MAQHAKLSPSAAHRWMNCPGSVKLIGDIRSVGSQAAMLGTAAHRIIEVMIGSNKRDASKYLGCKILVDETGQGDTEIYGPDDVPNLGTKKKPRTGWHLFIADQKMIDGVQLMLDTVDEAIGKLFKPEVIGERFLDMSWLDDRLGGTADCTLVEPFGWAHLLDYKNGYGVVEVDDNEQFMNYGVGILHEHPDAEGVRMTVVQPNARHDEGTVRTVEYTRDELKEFERELKEAADATAKPNAPLRAGSWCQWCEAKTRCPEFEKKMAEEAGADFADDPPPELLTGPVVTNADHKAALKKGEDLKATYNAGLAKKAKWIPLFDQWARDIEAEIENALMNGDKVPGYKLVEGKTNRKWIDEGCVAAVVGEIGIDTKKLYTPPKLLSPAQVEKLGAGKEQRKLVKDAVASLTMKPPGKITVALDTDPRPEALPGSDALADFADDPVE